MNLIIIGNGFDLSHGLKTSYNDFVDYVKSEHRKDKNKFTQFYRYNSKGLLEYPNKFYSLIEKQATKNWCDIETQYYDNLNKYQDPSYLNKEFNEVKSALFDYLATQNALSHPISGYVDFFGRLKGPNHVINFNYTDTLRHYKSSFNKIINIHGQLNDTDNPPIFGYAANQNETLKLLELNDDSYLQNIKQYEYLNTSNFERLQQLLHSNTRIKVLILGHSCGLSDQLILKTILEDESVFAIFNFYYKNVMSHKIKLININRTTSEQTGFQKFKPYPSSLRMPQFDEDISTGEIDQFFEINTNYKL